MAFPAGALSGGAGSSVRGWDGSGGGRPTFESNRRNSNLSTTLSMSLSPGEGGVKDDRFGGSGESSGRSRRDEVSPLTGEKEGDGEGGSEVETLDHEADAAATLEL